MLIFGQDVTRYLHNFNKRHCLSVTHLRAYYTFSFEAIIDLGKNPSISPQYVIVYKRKTAIPLQV
jgi:hypothetical protein